MDLEAVRTFVTASDAGQFQAAADELGITQQAVSKRVAGLERALGVTLFTRSARGSALSVDGQAFLPHARELLRSAARARASVEPGRRAVRVDVLNRRTAPAAALHAFHRAHPELALDVVTLADASLDSAVAAVESGVVDATFRAVARSPRRLPAGIRAEHVIDDRHQVLLGPKHPLAQHRAVTLAELSAHRMWMPGMRAETEWGTYYTELAGAHGLQIDMLGPSFGTEALLDELAGSAALATLVGEGSRYLWPEAYDLRRIPIVDPTPVYPHSLLWRADNAHPVLAAFLAHLRAARERTGAADTWVPAWAS